MTNLLSMQSIIPCNFLMIHSRWFIRLTFLEKTHEEAQQESELMDKSKAANKFTEAK